MTKKCLDCKATVIDDLESEMENEVPMWYKSRELFIITKIIKL